MKSQFYISFGDRTSFRAKALRSDKCKSKSQFYLSFWRSNLISCERIALGQVQIKIAILPQFLSIEPHFVRKGCDRTREIAILHQFLAIEPHFARKGCDRTREIAILQQFLAIEPCFVRKGCVSCRLVGTAPRLRERNRQEGESKRAREQESKRARGQESKRARENVKM